MGSSFRGSFWGYHRAEVSGGRFEAGLVRFLLQPIEELHEEGEAARRQGSPGRRPDVILEDHGFLHSWAGRDRLSHLVGEEPAWAAKCEKGACDRAGPELVQDVGFQQDLAFPTE